MYINEIFLCFIRLSDEQLLRMLFPKNGLPYRSQVVNLWHKTKQGISISEPETSLYIIGYSKCKVDMMGF